MAFYTIPTTIGLAKLANAEITGTKVLVTHFAVGDGNGAPITPMQNMTALVHEVWRGSVNIIKPHDTHSNWVVIEGAIPTDVGGWVIREVGLFDAAGDLVAIGNFPDTQKPVLAAGAAADVYLRMILAVENVATVELTVDLSLILATRKWVMDQMANERAEMEANAFYQPLSL